ncbi:MAG: hypothetical protein OEZ01_08905 [Candidatus Heimdallarchaeota archaeon]|nr:hypothetical protein [Candidatus Heimdallarchaeota archaeon]MDH5646113.1 hypothetical protein [Candidatus Heimdallarchaeota archaeon]
MTYSNIPELDELILKFNDIYDKQGVTVEGQWFNAVNKKEAYLVTGYNEKDRYDKFIVAVKNDEVYQSLSKELAKDRGIF